MYVHDITVPHLEFFTENKPVRGDGNALLSMYSRSELISMASDWADVLDQYDNELEAARASAVR